MPKEIDTDGSVIMPTRAVLELLSISPTTLWRLRDTRPDIFTPVKLPGVRNNYYARSKIEAFLSEILD